jgi:hypothetical protein
MTTTAMSGLSEAEPSSALRKAVIAATIGTTIEWYDFLFTPPPPDLFSASYIFRTPIR